MDNQSDSATVRFAVNDAHSIAFSNRVWSLTDAQANLPEVLRLAEAEDPQYIEAAGTFVVTLPEPETGRDQPELTLGQWLYGERSSAESL